MANSPGAERVLLSAPEKWTVLRSLHEGYGVPLEVLKPLGVCTDENFAKKTAGWHFGSSARTMLTRMSGAVDKQLTAFQLTSGDSCDEKHARALSVMAKTLETIASVERRLGEDEIKKGARKSDADRATEDQRLGAAALEAEMAELVEALS